MAGPLSRSQLLRWNFKAGRRPSRPPWALDGDRFLEACEAGEAGESCDKCLGACPERILGKGPDGYPEISFARGGCTFCAECVIACPTGALSRRESETEDSRAPWAAVAEIANGCLSLAGVACRVCGEQCESEAITFRLAVGGVALTVVEPSLCTGCGACCAPCPVDAIRIRRD